MICRNTLLYSRKSGVYSALGLGLGIGVHVTYSLLGIALIISRSLIVFSIIKYIGAAYLIYIGIQSLRSSRTRKLNHFEHSCQDLTPFKAVISGFLTNVLNPKASLFFLALFTQVINPHTPLKVQLIYGIWMMIATFIWFAFLAGVLSHRQIRDRFSKLQHRIEQVLGCVLIALGIKVALSTR